MGGLVPAVLGAAHGHEVLFNTTHEVLAHHLACLQATAISARGTNLANGLTAVLNARNMFSAPPLSRAVFETCAVPLYMRRNLLRRVRKGKTEQVHRLLYRLGLGTRLDTAVHAWKPIEVANLIKAMANEIDAVMETPAEDDEDSKALGLSSYRAVIDLTYSMLSEFTHPNQAGMTPSTGVDARGYSTWTLQPELRDSIVVACAIRPAWLTLRAGGAALDTVMDTMEQHPMVLPDEPPTFPKNELKRPVS